MQRLVLERSQTDGVQPDVAFARGVLEGNAAPEQRLTSGVRTSGIMATPVAAISSREKVVWRWPDTGERLIEEL